MKSEGDLHQISINGSLVVESYVWEKYDFQPGSALLLAGHASLNLHTLYVLLFLI
jgi:hypothetical protein